MIKQIVVGTDGSQGALDAYRRALLLAERIGGEVKCVFIVDLRKTQTPFIYAGGSYEGAFERLYIPPDESMRKFYERIADDLDAFADKCMADYRTEAENHGIPFESVVKSGYPGLELSDEACSGGLLVVGRRGENAHYKRSIVGSITEDLIRQSPRPILVCPRGRGDIGSVLFPYDGSRSAENALQYYVNGLKPVAKDFVMLLVGDETPEEHHVEEELNYLRKHDIVPRTVFRRGTPGTEILRVAEEEKVDLIMVGSHGRHKLRDYLLGSTTSHIIHKSKVPVLVVY